MLFTPIDVNAWPRAQVFHYFSKMAPTQYSITVDVDVTRLRATLKSANRKFFPAYLYLVTKCLNEQAEFKIAVKDGALGYYDVLTPLYASFHEDDKTFSLMWTEYAEDFSDFYEAYLDNQARYGGSHGVLAQPGLPPANAYTVSCVPWISFSHFAVLGDAGKAYYFPSVEAGKFKEQDGKILMPLSLTCHHATTDGWHLHQFLDSLQAQADEFCV